MNLKQSLVTFTLLLFLLPCISFATTSNTALLPTKDIYSNDDCKKVLLKNGETMMIKIVSLSKNILSYTPCDNPEANEINLPLGEVSAIITKDGDKIYETPIGFDDEKVIRWSALAILVTILGIWPPFGLLLGPLAFFLARRIRREAKKNPKLYFNKVMITVIESLAVVVTIISAVVAVLILSWYF